MKSKPKKEVGKAVGHVVPMTNEKLKSLATHGACHSDKGSKGPKGK